MQRNEYLDAFRGISIVLVVLFHYSARLPAEALFVHPEEIPHAMFFGWMGVYIFFIISGYSIYGSLIRSKDATDFAAKRLARIYPPFVIASTLVFAYQTVFYVPSFRIEDWSFNSSEKTLIDYTLTTFFMARDLGFEWVDGAYWTLLVEVKFYLAMALVFGFGLLNNFRTLDFVLTLGLPAIWAASVLIDLHFVEFVLRNAFLAPYFPFFMLGIRMARKQDSTLIIAANLAVVTGALYLIASDKSTPYEIPVVTTAIFCLITAALLWAMKMSKPAPKWLTDFPIFKALSFAGVYSFSWYLLHQNIGISLVYHFSQWLDPYASVAAATISTLAMALVFSTLFEHRFREKAHRILKSLLDFALSKVARPVT